jgi:putative transposase
VIDCATRKIVGWAMDDNYKTPLIISAIEMAARNLDLPEDAIFHSDYAEVLVKPRIGEPACA